MDAEDNPVPSAEVRFAHASGAIDAGYTLYAAAEGAVTAAAEKDSVALGVALTGVPDGGIVAYRILAPKN